MFFVVFILIVVMQCDTTVLIYYLVLDTYKQVMKFTNENSDFLSILVYSF